MGLISRVSSRTYRLCVARDWSSTCSMADEQDEVRQEFNMFRAVVASHTEEIDRVYIRRLEHEAYKAAAVCTADTDRDTSYVRNCVKSSFDKFEHATKLFRVKQEQINKALEMCMKECQAQASLALPDEKAMENEERVTRVRNDYNTCILSCPRKTVPTVESAFKNLADVL